MTRRHFITALTGGVAAAATAKAKEPRTEAVYMVRAELKCTEVQAALLEGMLKSMGKQFGALPKYPEDWRVTKKLYGAWQVVGSE